MRFRRPVAVGLGGAVLALTVSMGAAFAADGSFAWIGPKGKGYSITDPPDGHCFDMGQEARGAVNGTKKSLTVYTGKKCSGSATRLAPGKSVPEKTPFASVKFGTE